MDPDDHHNFRVSSTQLTLVCRAGDRVCLVRSTSLSLCFLKRIQNHNIVFCQNCFLLLASYLRSIYLFITNFLTFLYSRSSVLKIQITQKYQKQSKMDVEFPSLYFLLSFRMVFNFYNYHFIISRKCIKWRR